jgi:hypothetical protein
LGFIHKITQIPDKYLPPKGVKQGKILKNPNDGTYAARRSKDTSTHDFDNLEIPPKGGFLVKRGNLILRTLNIFKKNNNQYQTFKRNEP